MLAEIEGFVNWLRRCNAEARTWRDYGYDLKQFVEVVGDQPPAAITFHDVDRFGGAVQQLPRNGHADRVGC
jgi:hypothetical protein